MPKYRLQISANLLAWPRSCACCCGTADSELRAAAARTTGSRVVHTKTKWWEVPHCGRCVAHIVRYRSSDRAASLVRVLGFVAAVGFGVLAASFATAVVTMAVTLLVAAVVRSKVRRGAAGLTTSACAGPGTAVGYVRWHGTMHEFEFSHQHYLELFIAANGRKTMSDVRTIG